MNITQGILHSVEEGKARIVTRLVPLLMTVLIVIAGYDVRIYNGLNDAQSMDNAQLARQIVHGLGFTTKFIRPYALGQANAALAQKANTSGKAAALFPDAQYPKGTERLLPDTYNSPGYPYLLAQWFKLTVPDFYEAPRQIALTRIYAPDRKIPWLNQSFLLSTAGLIFILGLRLFDQRVAWVGMLAFLLTNLVWQYSITALSTSFLMFLFTVVLLAAVEIFAWGDSRSDGEKGPVWPAWLWTLILSVTFGVACLTRLNLLFLLTPLAIFLFAIPQGSKLSIAFMILIVLAMTAPWFWNMYKITGSPLGSNGTLLHYGAEGHDGNQVFCTVAAPEDQQMFKDVAGKEFLGFGWAFAHGWEMLGTNPVAFLFFASILHSFKRRKAQAFRWLVLGSVFVVIFATSFGSPHPGALDSWNSLIVLLPGILVVGSAFFFILVDRLNLQLWTLSHAIGVALLILVSCPMIGALMDARGNRAYPPYYPAAIRAMGDFAHKEDWVTSDMPWAMAWYGDHASLWIPDTLADFDDIYDNYNNSGLLLITPVLLGAPTMTFTSGEYKDWLPFVSGSALPANFPLNTRAPTGAGAIEYFIWGRPAGT